MTSWKEEGLAQGLQQGVAHGLQQGASDLALRQLRRRFGLLPETLEARIMDLSTAPLREFGEALLDFATLDDAEVWLSQHG